MQRCVCPTPSLPLSLRSVFYFHGNSTSGEGWITLERSLAFACAKSCGKFVSLALRKQSVIHDWKKLEALVGVIMQMVAEDKGWPER